MKKSITLVLFLILCLSLYVLSGCNNEDKKLSGPEVYKEKYGYEAYVKENADILGAWVENLSADSKSDKTVWNFEDSTTLNIVETVDNHNLTVGCAYNFNDDTNELSYFILDTKEEIKVTVVFSGNTMSFTDDSGQTVKTFVKE